MKQLFFILFSACAFLGKAQENFSYANGHGSNIQFSVSDKKFVIRLKSGEPLSRLVKTDFQIINKQYGLVEISSTSTSKSQHLQQIQVRNSDKEIIQEPVLIYRDEIEQVVLGEMILKLDGNSLEELLGEYSYSASSDQFIEGQFLIKFDNLSTEEIFELSNELNQSSKVDFAEPNFTRFLKPHTTDPFYNSQWALRNQGYLGGTVDADMDVDLAWNTATGQGIKVAIIDEGVDLSHNDLNANLLAGYDATSGSSSGGSQGNDAHGTSCAGIVAARANNNKGIARVAYNAKIMPIRIAFQRSDGSWNTSDSWIADSINWAVNNGAHILSNSWGGGSPSNTYPNPIRGKGDVTVNLILPPPGCDSSVSSYSLIENVPESLVEDELLTITIIDNSGNTICTETPTGISTVIQTDGLDRGIYYVHVQTVQGRTFQSRIIKN